MATISVILEMVLNALRFCEGCCKVDAKEEKDADDIEEAETEKSESESDIEESTKPVPTQNKKKSRKKRRNLYSGVVYDNQVNPTINIINNQPQPAPIHLSGKSALALPVMNPGQSETAALATEQKSLVEWVPSSIEKASELVARAVVGGYDIDDSDLWVIKVRFKCEVIPGKLNYHHRLAFVACKTDESYAERNVSDFEVCCIAPGAVHRIRWIKCSNGDVPRNAVEGGRKSTGEKLYIGRHRQDDEVHPGRHSLCPGMIQPSHGVLYVTYDFKVYAHKFYEVMCIE